MTTVAHIGSRPLRIIPGSTPAAPDETRQRRFDYASLVRAQARRGPVTRSAPPPPPGSEGGWALAPPSGSCDEAAPAAGNTTRAPSTPFDEPLDGNPVIEPPTCPIDAHESFGRVRHAIAPVVSVIVERQSHFTRIVGMLAREIGAFCSDGAIVCAGNWEAQLTLDPELLPRTTLHVALSRFIIRIRFDVPDGETRDLLLTHRSLLERELDEVMRCWGEARDIQLSVW
ncbi:type III secretion system protein SctP [Burkholderia pseudomallei]|uniref:type III secretion system protein SctP n=1 Tax=Burkholderia pseudomallei TaxID=28450 RepID=UPI0001A42526|nr:type III secretion system protein SctP [Burkholderia pseudomallei]APF95256.1 type III secretion protein HpaP [Burkholderia pseudomallei]APG01301.1 type III secretion protein HpaP [Burkholderia pseudomallei]APY95257.1 type III secretion protein HpaP [Burkholderia pseudomallei]APZ21053.1 type III secretion protein HpaP [Burkholderia pseudomallei]APZ27252.1 type III secretion protein HpaP [Burkholderia pseudomallei]